MKANLEWLNRCSRAGEIEVVMLVPPGGSLMRDAARRVRHPSAISLGYLRRSLAGSFYGDTPARTREVHEAFLLWRKRASVKGVVREERCSVDHLGEDFYELRRAARQPVPERVLPGPGQAHGPRRGAAYEEVFRA